MLKRVVKLLTYLVIVGGVALSVYAYFGDLSPTPSDQSLTVTLDAN